WPWRRLSEPLSPFWCGLSGAPGCVTWELILDGYSESSYSATPRFAAARLPWFLALQVAKAALAKRHWR
ncbi:hypothetical protein ABZO91_003885, partial [Proteus mirabilis]